MEHIFDARTDDMCGTLVRSIGLLRAEARIELKNLAYNMKRAVPLTRRGKAPAPASWPARGDVCPDGWKSERR